MFTVEQSRVNKRLAVTTLGPFQTIEEARSAGRELYDGPPGLIVGMDTLRILKDGKEVESFNPSSI
jgi:hypothetical protein